jgi:hypothetical protein
MKKQLCGPCLRSLKELPGVIGYFTKFMFQIRIVSVHNIRLLLQQGRILPNTYCTVNGTDF